MLRLAFILLALVSLSGCTITIDPRAEYDEEAKREPFGAGYAAQPKAGEAVAGATLSSSSENVTLQVEQGAWNTMLAREVMGQLNALGAAVDSGVEVTVALMDYDYNQSGIYVKTHEIDVEIEVTAGAFRKRYKGRGETASSSSNASWQAAGDAVLKVIADPEFRAAIKSK